MGITVKEVPVEAHWSVGKIERYYGPLRRAFEILNAELGTTCSKDSILQMAVKAVNSTAGPNGLVPTLLVFGAYPRMNFDSPPSPSTIQRQNAMDKAMKELRTAAADRQIRDALDTRNGPDVSDVLGLPIGHEVRIYREKKGWTGPFKILSIKGHNIVVDMPGSHGGSTKFRSTVVKPFYREDIEEIPDLPAAKRIIPNDERDSDDEYSPEADPEAGANGQPVKRGRRRPKGSKNKPKVPDAQFLAALEHILVQ
ncbi:hypothetical protein F5B17DRAFT_42530 [Nemania serpens]|nr:hypothetical protein F5B17DRAFT_42530 [Nemania serpens]